MLENHFRNTKYSDFEVFCKKLFQKCFPELKYEQLWWKQLLTHLFPVHPFFTSWKHQKTWQFSDVFRG